MHTYTSSAAPVKRSIQVLYFRSGGRAAPSLLESSAPGGPSGHSRRQLFCGLGVGVDDFRCGADVESRGDEEPNPTHSIVFVRRGAFTRACREGTILADANQILFFNQGQGYRYAHPLPGGDECTILALDEDRAREEFERVAPRPARKGSEPFSIGHAPSTPRAARLHLELVGRLSSAKARSPLAVQEVIAELVEESLRALHGVPPARPASSRRRDLVEAAKLLLNESLAAPPSLVELASALSCSPFHLSRTFRAATGLGMRHYLRRLRCRLAADRLRRGALDLTELALDLGFYDHSHFTNAFRREWGVPPSRIRRNGVDR